MKTTPILQRAFTLVELLVVIAILAVLVALQIPALANTKSRVQVISCGDNLKRINVAFQTWAASHAARFPMSIPTAFGGASEVIGVRATGTTFASNMTPTRRGVFAIFVALSNELTTPKILYCPSEYRANIAQGFIFGDSAGTNTGFFNDNGTSYFVGVDAYSTATSMMLTGDHNLGDTGNPPATPNIYGDTKSNFISGGTNVLWGATAIGWGDNQHRRQGNVAFVDGSVQTLDTAQFRSALNKSGDSGRASNSGSAVSFINASGSLGTGMNRLQFP